jgi:hypothetical protein
VFPKRSRNCDKRNLLPFPRIEFYPVAVIKIYFYNKITLVYSYKPCSMGVRHEISKNLNLGKTKARFSYEIGTHRLKYMRRFKEQIIVIFM